MLYFGTDQHAKQLTVSLRGEDDDRARARIRSLKFDNDRHFIEYERDFLSWSSNSAASKITLWIVIGPCHPANL